MAALPFRLVVVEVAVVRVPRGPVGQGVVRRLAGFLSGPLEREFVPLAVAVAVVGLAETAGLDLVGPAPDVLSCFFRVVAYRLGKLLDRGRRKGRTKVVPGRSL